MNISNLMAKSISASDYNLIHIKICEKFFLKKFPGIIISESHRWSDSKLTSVKTFNFI